MAETKCELKQENYKDARYNVSIGMFKSEAGAVARRKASLDAGLRAEIIELKPEDNPDLMTYQALLLIAEQLKANTEALNKLRDDLCTPETGKTLSVFKPAYAIEAPKHEPTANEKLGEIIAAYRKKKHMTQTKLAKRLGCSASTICKIERGSEGASTRMFFKICKELEIPPEVYSSVY